MPHMAPDDFLDLVDKRIGPRPCPICTGTEWFVPPQPFLLETYIDNPVVEGELDRKAMPVAAMLCVECNFLRLHLITPNLPAQDDIRPLFHVIS